MCGRTACTLNPNQISTAMKYRNSKGKNTNPNWKKGDADKYRTSYNKAPMSYCPVLIHKKHLGTNDTETCDSDQDRVIASMKWGLVPSWVKDPSRAQFKMNNARSDTMLSKASYKKPLERGQRCVVLADGFYEWNTTKTEKQPYYIFFKDDAKVESKTDENKNQEQDEMKPQKRLVTIAGIFECRKSSDENEEDLFTFSVITVDAHPDFAWLHHRMPAMLETEEEVRRWLDFGEVPLKEAVDLIKPRDCLAWYPVSKIVNNSRNNSPECMEKIDLSKPKLSKESEGMAKWLSKTPTKSESIKSEKTSTVTTGITNSPSKNTSTSPQKKGQKRKNCASVNLMAGWLKKAKQGP